MRNALVNDPLDCAIPSADDYLHVFTTVSQPVDLAEARLSTLLAEHVADIEVGLLVVEDDRRAGMNLLDQLGALGAATARVDHDKQVKLSLDGGVSLEAALHELGLYLLLHSDWFSV